jgi:hypothetical protein
MPLEGLDRYGDLASGASIAIVLVGAYLATSVVCAIRSSRPSVPAGAAIPHR